MTNSRIKVLVGNLPITSGRSLAEIIEENDFSVKKVPILFPRDDFVYTGSGIVSSKDAGIFGEGGRVISGNGYIICLDKARFNCDGKEYILESEEIDKLLKQHYQSRVYLLDSKGLAIINENNLFLQHIDNYLCLLPKSKFLIVDISLFNNFDASKESLKRLCNKEGLRLIIYESSTYKLEYTSMYPCNAFVGIDNSDNEVVFVDKSADNLNNILLEAGVRVIPVNISALGTYIHCSTNVIPEKMCDNVVFTNTESRLAKTQKDVELLRNSK